MYNIILYNSFLLDILDRSIHHSKLDKKNYETNKHFTITFWNTIKAQVMFHMCFEMCHLHTEYYIYILFPLKLTRVIWRLLIAYTISNLFVIKEGYFLMEDLSKHILNSYVHHLVPSSQRNLSQNSFNFILTIHLPLYYYLDIGYIKVKDLQERQEGQVYFAHGSWMLYKHLNFWSYKRTTTIDFCCCLK